MPPQKIKILNIRFFKIGSYTAFRVRIKKAFSYAAINLPYLVFFLIINLSLYLSLKFFSIERPLLLIDYFFVLIFYRYPFLLASLFIFILLCDLLVHISPYFHYRFINIGQVFLDSMASFPSLTILFIVAVLVINFLIYLIQKKYKVESSFLIQCIVFAFVSMSIFQIDALFFGRTFNTYSKAVISKSTLWGNEINLGSSLSFSYFAEKFKGDPKKLVDGSSIKNIDSATII
jgi:uncharacterized membrane protein (DUF4010 family)